MKGHDIQYYTVSKIHNSLIILFVGFVTLPIRRWIGDYGGQKQKFFPANYCEEINYVAEEEQNVNPQNDNSEVRKGFWMKLFF